MNLPPSATTSGWQNYWHADRAASCMPENPQTAQQIAASWTAWFATLPSASRILDVATGNGIVLAHAAQAARATAKTFALTGVDLADIDPVRHVKTLDVALRNATFRGGISAESLPFAQHSFDVVTSQYGLEYAELDQAIAEAARVLAPGGRLRILAHCEGSEIVAQHREQVREVDFLTASGGPLEIMRGFVAGAQRRSEMRMEMDALLGAFAAAEKFCRTYPPARVVREVCGEFAQVAKRWSAYDPTDLAKMLDDAARELTAHRSRIGDLLRAVLSAERLDRVRAHLSRESWHSFAIEELRVGSGPSFIGLLITAQRTPAD